MSFAKLLEVSRQYGKNPGMVLLGGGNTSFKDGNTLYVKASGHALGSITEQGFVRMDLKRMSEIWKKAYSKDDDERENQVLKDMMDCRLSGETARPSVEALLHASLPFTYVVHLHPALVNGVTCACKGKETIQRLFPDSLWIGLVKPGYILANVVRESMEKRVAGSGKTPKVIFLQNHGVFVGSDTLQEVRQLYDDLIGCIQKEVVRNPDFTPVAMDDEKRQIVVNALSGVCNVPVVTAFNIEFQRILRDSESFAPVSSSFTPDHIVYSGFKPLWVENKAAKGSLSSSVGQAYKAYAKEYGTNPKVVCVQNLGVFAFGENALLLFTDTVAVSVYSLSFGGPRFMDSAMIDFIRTWEVEKYRSSIASK
jgi:rhamnose utilization protein RhaD (predicted bifunctional aldolase and dehydrogenase)